MKKEYVYISELSQLTGLKYSILKTYTELGFLPYKQEGFREWKLYDKEKCLQIINRIKELKAQRYKLNEIKKILKDEFKI